MLFYVYGDRRHQGESDYLNNDQIKCVAEKT